MTTIGLRRYYETMVFEAMFDKPYWEADIEKEVSFDSLWRIAEAKNDSDLAANDMHERVVDEMSRRLEGGKTDGKESNDLEAA